MVERARFRDRRYFCSDATAARELGVSRRTIIRWRERLEQRGRITREGLSRIGPCRKTVVYIFPPEARRTPRVTQRATRRKPTPFRSTPYGRRSAQAARERRSMSDELARASEQLPGERISAQDIVRAVVDTMALHQVPVTGRARGIIGKQAKELLADGFSPATILAAATIALRRAEPHVTHFIAQDIALAQAGQLLSRSQYKRELEDATSRLNPALERIRGIANGGLPA